MTQVTLDQAIQIAIQHHQAGRLAEAEAIYRQVLTKQPNHPGALHLLGIIAFHVGRLDTAADLIRQAIALDPSAPDYHSNLGNIWRAKGQLDDAITAYRQAIQLKPQFAEAHANLSTCLREKGRLDDAIAASRRAIEIRPDYAEAHSHLGTALGAKGDFDAAILAFRQAMALKPDYADAHFNMGTALRDKGLPDEAILSYRRAIELKPDFMMAHFNVGNVLRDQGRLEEAIAAHYRAIALAPMYADAHNNLANALKDAGQIEEATDAYRRAIALSPQPFGTSANPHHANTHWNLALALLLQGDFSGGWAEYEWRFQCEWYHRPPQFTQPQWDGGALTGRTILIHAEQGLGDTLQFARYTTLLAERGARVIFQCSPLLARLLKTAPGVTQVIATDDPLPAFDLHCPLLSLPRLFGTALTTIPAPVPYLKPDPELVAHWANKLQATPAPHPKDTLKIGLVWGGNASYGNDRTRSIALAQFSPLATIPGLTFYSLQKSEAATQAAHPPSGMNFIDLAADLHDFADTAALISHLDLVITVDTAVAHLAGALAKPVWLLLPFAPDWRWMLRREDTPWYPTTRLFRQSTRADWDSVIRRVVESLRELKTMAP